MISKGYGPVGRVGRVEPLSISTLIPADVDHIIKPGSILLSSLYTACFDTNRSVLCVVDRLRTLIDTGLGLPSIGKVDFSDLVKVMAPFHGPLTIA